MPDDKIQSNKARLHPRNRNRNRYDLDALLACTPELKDHIVFNKHQVETIDFANPIAVKLLNKALLDHYYGIENWIFPDENLCPPIPGRADYIHHMADLLGGSNFGTIPTGVNIRGLDVGVGASCIYPIIGVIEYGWTFVGCDTDPQSITSAQSIVDSNPSIKENISLRLQKQSTNIFSSIIKENERFDLTMCNPPFHASMEDAQRGTQRKIKGLTGKHTDTPKLNFSGNARELVYDGGEFGFIKRMIGESKQYSQHCFWYSTLVSKQSNLKRIQKHLENIQASAIRVINLGTGNKSTRIVAWTFLDRKEQKEWRKRW